MAEPGALGKYHLIRRIAAGGMGEIWLAKLSGPVGFEKLVAIKRILAQHVENQEFLDMFFSEARVAAQLSHSNIVQIYEMGQVEDSYFIAMEYVHGKSLNELIQAAKNQVSALHPAHSADIIARVCAGMSYAHNAADLSGSPLSLIHRDLNPHNVLISYTGEVKIIDFGIAKSEVATHKTEAGIVKGKYLYMSPEQSAARPLDKRSDIFAIGICLYECLTGINPFALGSLVASLTAIQFENPPPLTDFDRQLEPFEPIVRKALAKSPEQRYADCEDMRTDLLQVLHRQLEPAPQQLRAYVRELFAQQIDAEQQALTTTDRRRLADLSRTPPPVKAIFEPVAPPAAASAPAPAPTVIASAEPSRAGAAASPAAGASGLHRTSSAGQKPPQVSAPVPVPSLPVPVPVPVAAPLAAPIQDPAAAPAAAAAAAPTVMLPIAAPATPPVAPFADPEPTPTPVEVDPRSMPTVIRMGVSAELAAATAGALAPSDMPPPQWTPSFSEQATQALVPAQAIVAPAAAAPDAAAKASSDWSGPTDLLTPIGAPVAERRRKRRLLIFAIAAGVAVVLLGTGAFLLRDRLRVAFAVLTGQGTVAATPTSASGGGAATAAANDGSGSGGTTTSGSGAGDKAGFDAAPGTASSTASGTGSDTGSGSANPVATGDGEAVHLSPLPGSEGGRKNDGKRTDAGTGIDTGIDTGTSTDGAAKPGEVGKSGDAPTKAAATKTKAGAPAPFGILSIDADPTVPIAYGGAKGGTLRLKGANGSISVGKAPFAVTIRYRVNRDSIMYAVDSTPSASVRDGSGSVLGKTPLPPMPGGSDLTLKLEADGQRLKLRLQYQPKSAAPAP